MHYVSWFCVKLLTLASHAISSRTKSQWDLLRTGSLLFGCTFLSLFASMNWGKKIERVQLSECKNQYPGTNFIAYHAEIHNFITLWHDGSFNLFALGQKSDQSHINTLQHIKETFSHSPPDKANCKIFHHPGIYKEALIKKNCTSSMSDTRRVFSVA